MHIPNISRFNPTLLALGAALAVFATILYIQIVTKLNSVGIKPLVFVSVKRLVSIFTIYSEMAPDKGWPRWPTKGFWMASILAILIVVILGLQLK